LTKALVVGECCNIRCLTTGALCFGELVENKTCLICGCQKSINEFNPKRNQCKQCRNEYDRKWKNNHLEQRKEYNRKYYKEHVDEYNNRRHKWRENNPKYMLEYNLKWVEEHKERHKLNRCNADHRRRQLEGNGKITLEEWNTILSNQKNRCYWCKVKFNDTDKKPTQDHVIPLKKKGFHEASNIVAACKPCNSKKHTQIWSLV